MLSLFNLLRWAGVVSLNGLFFKRYFFLRSVDEGHEMLGLIFLEPDGQERLLIVESISVVRAIDHLVAVLFTKHFASKNSDLSNFIRVLRVPISLVHESSRVVSRDFLNSFRSEEILSIIVILGLSLTLFA